MRPGVAEIVIGFGETGRQLDRRLIVGNRLGPAAGVGERNAEVVERIRICRSDLQGVAVVFHGAGGVSGIT